MLGKQSGYFFPLPTLEVGYKIFRANNGSVKRIYRWNAITAVKDQETYGIDV